MKFQDAIKSIIERRMEQARTHCELIIHEAMTIELIRIKQQHFPKRKLHFMDAMGATIIWLDEEGTFDLAHRLGDRCPDGVRELEVLRNWYIDVTADANICIEDIKL
jgi:hypothetical protein